MQFTIPANLPAIFYLTLARFWLRFSVRTLTILVMSFISHTLVAAESFTVQVESYRVVKVAADDSLNVRAKPELTAVVVAALPPDTRVTVTGRGMKDSAGRSWLEVHLSGNRTGWANRFYLSPLAVRQSSQSQLKPQAKQTKPQTKPQAQQPATSSSNSQAQQTPASSNSASMPPKLDKLDPNKLNLASSAQAFVQTLTCSGTEPFWKLEFQGEKVRYVQGSTPLYIWPQFVYQQSANSSVVWWLEAPATDVSPRLQAVLDRAGACTDGMSDKNYIYRLTGKVGGRVYSGCCSAP